MIGPLSFLVPHGRFSMIVSKDLTTGSPQPDGSWTGSMGTLFRNVRHFCFNHFSTEKSLVFARKKAKDTFMIVFVAKKKNIIYRTVGHQTDTNMFENYFFMALTAF